MAKKQTFAEKAKKQGGKGGLVTVKFIKSVKSDKGSYKFQENLVKLEDVNSVTNLK
ncbi:MAG: DUF4295 family protein [Bacteroidetes bacterium]|nr:DUF4295 family protein [Bacteroidota bacterium]